MLVATRIKVYTKSIRSTVTQMPAIHQVSVLIPVSMLLRFDAILIRQTFFDPDEAPKPLLWTLFLIFGLAICFFATQGPRR